MKVHHTDGSPLLLCDTCPRSTHLACLRGAEFGSLPPVDWSCSKCIERQAAALKRLAELEAHRNDAVEKCATSPHCGGMTGRSLDCIPGNGFV